MPVRSAHAAAALVAGLLVAVGAPGATHAAITAADTPVQVSVVVPLTAPVGSSGLLTVDALEHYTSPGGLLTRQLEAVAGRPVTIAIDPMILVSIRVLGSSAPQSALEWLDRLEGVTNETFPLGYADSGLTLQLQAGSTAPAKPQSFDFAIDPGLFSDPESPSPTPTETGNATSGPTDAPPNNEQEGEEDGEEEEDAGPPPLPSTDDLLAWPYTMPGMAWPGEGSVTAPDLEALKAAEYETVILGSANVDRSGSPRSPLATVNDTDVLVSDAEVSSLVRAAAATVSEEDWTAGMAAVSDALAGVSRSGDGSVRGILITLGRGPLGSDSWLGETIQAIDALPSVTLTPLSVAMETESSTATLVESPLPEETVALFESVLSAQRAENRFATMIENPVDFTAPRQLEVLVLASHSWRHNPEGWPVAISEFRERSVELRSAVQVVESSTNNFFADRQSLYIPVNNTLPHRVTVYITVRPESPLIRVEDSRVELTIEPDAQGRGAVPVESISNGVVDVTVTLTSSTGVSIGDPATLELNVQAGWETPITIGIAVIVVLIFGVGIARTIVRRRRSVRE